MSYILDALKRAEAERGRGGVPTLHSQAVPATAPPQSRTAVANWIAAMAVTALLVVVVLWWWAGPTRSPTPASASARVTIPAPSPSPASTPAPPALAAQAAAPEVAASPVRPVVPTAAAAPPALPPVLPTAVPAEPVTTRKTAEPQRAATAAPRPAASAATAPASAALPNQVPQTAVSPQEQIYSLSDLPADVRAQLPALAISGASYSGQAVYRIAIINGQVLRENESPAPGVTLESVRQKDVVLRFKGYRYTMGY